LVFNLSNFFSNFCSFKFFSRFLIPNFKQSRVYSLKFWNSFCNISREILQHVWLACFGVYESIVISKCEIMLQRSLLKWLTWLINCLLLEDWTHTNAIASVVRHNQFSIDSLGHLSTPVVADIQASVSTSIPAHLWWQHRQRGRLQRNNDASFSDQLDKTCIGMFLHDKMVLLFWPELCVLLVTTEF